MGALGVVSSHLFKVGLMSSKLTPAQKLQNLQDALVSDILDLSDGELRAEMKADGIDPDKEADRVKALIERVIAENGHTTQTRS